MDIIGLISGFPGETQEDHEELMEFVDEIEFDRLGVFPYSAEEDTPAATMEDQIPEEVKEARRDEIMELQQEISLEKGESRVGQVLTVMIEGKVSGESAYIGRTYGCAEGRWIYFCTDRRTSYDRRFCESPGYRSSGVRFDRRAGR